MPDEIGTEQPRQRPKHGGARRGAGRPLKLTEEQRQQIGIDCFRLENKILRAHLGRKRRNFLAQSELSDHIPHSRARLLTRQELDVRRALIADEEREREYLLRSGQSDKTLREDLIEFELHQLAGTDPQSGAPPARWFSLTVATPPGLKKRIRQFMAARWSRRIGVAVSQWTVRDCWKEVRDLRDDLLRESRNSEES